MIFLDLPDNEYFRLLNMIRNKYDYDFSKYSKASMLRRISRFIINKNIRDLGELNEKVFKDKSFFETFLQEITVNVTEMFRDPSFYLALRSKVVPYLKTYPSLKLWDAGCSTGEETYSLAILLKEETLFNKTRIYATDINQKVLNTAKDGIYPIAYMKDYSRNYLNAGGHGSLSDYYFANYNNAILNNELSRNLVFSIHNLAQDGSFNEFNLIVCRNVLIYFQKELQEKVLGLFLESLPMFGFLALGNKESIRFTKIQNHFEVIDDKEKIYRRIK